MSFTKLVAVMICAVALAACQGGKGKGSVPQSQKAPAKKPEDSKPVETPAKPAGSVVGLWMEEDEASELEETGKLESLREELAAKDTKLSNLRKIDEDGHVTIPLEGGATAAKMGDLGNDGILKLEVRIAKALEEGGNPVKEVKVSMDGEVMVIEAVGGGSIRYVRIDQAKAEEYFKALAALQTAN